MFKKNYALLILSFTLSLNLFGQGIFDSALEGEGGTSGKEGSSFEYNGYIKGNFTTLFNKEDIAKSQFGASYVELDTELSFKPGNFFLAYADLRVKQYAGPSLLSNYEGSFPLPEVTLRELFLDFYFKHFEFSFGNQIEVWGRADGINPTNKLSPSNFAAISANPDDTRMSNLMAISSIFFGPMTLKGVWVVSYRPSNIEAFIPNTDIEKPDTTINNTSGAVKLDLVFSDFEFSLSYFNGFNPEPGLESLQLTSLGTDGLASGGGGPVSLDFETLSSATKKFVPYRIHNFGGDFATAIKSVGVRGEIAYRLPYGGPSGAIYIPNPDLSYIFGIDYTIDWFSVVAQYSGHFTQDFTSPHRYTNPSAAITQQLNRVLNNQVDEVTHSVTILPKVQVLHETLTLQIPITYDITANGYLLKPMISYDVIDAVTVSLGLNWYEGEDDSMFGLLESLRAVYVEVLSSF